ncbi:MAG TPA: hypothetical protein VHR72_12060 [Gemmataceae bacterium]|nr:hypothetical protein [Gemmataceae bacterium]
MSQRKQELDFDKVRSDAVQLRERCQCAVASTSWADGVSLNDLVAMRKAIHDGTLIPLDVRRAVAAAVVDKLDAGLRDRKTISLVRTFVAMQETAHAR